jgi:hypothetical protein
MLRSLRCEQRVHRFYVGRVQLERSEDGDVLPQSKLPLHHAQRCDDGGTSSWTTKSYSTHAHAADAHATKSYSAHT